MTASSSPAPRPTPRRSPPSDEPATKPATPAVPTPAVPTPAVRPDVPTPAATSPSVRPAVTDPTARPARDGAKHAAEPTVGQLVSDASAHLSTLIRGEIELAKLELRATVKNAGTGAGLFAGAAVVLVFSLIFGFIALAEGIAALGLSRWLAFLIVFGFQAVVVALFVYVGIKKVKRVRAPARTIKTTKETVDYLKKSRG